MKLLCENGAGADVKLLRGRICVESDWRDPESVKRQLSGWYGQRAADVFARRLEAIVKDLPWIKHTPPLRLLRMSKQLGSCSPKGTLLLNPHLVKARRECVDYVLAHELCHLKEHNHSPRYYRRLRQIMPGREPVKAKLDGMAELLLNE